MKYKIELINESGCCFDSAEFNTKSEARKWASGRGTVVKYRANLYLNVINAEHSPVDTWQPRG